MITIQGAKGGRQYLFQEGCNSGYHSTGHDTTSVIKISLAAPCQHSQRIEAAGTAFPSHCWSQIISQILANPNGLGLKYPAGKSTKLYAG
jgi:hypothetical protein